jgi:hypothetical protein
MRATHTHSSYAYESYAQDSYVFAICNKPRNRPLRLVIGRRDANQRRPGKAFKRGEGRGSFCFRIKLMTFFDDQKRKLLILYNVGISSLLNGKNSISPIYNCI